MKRTFIFVVLSVTLLLMLRLIVTELRVATNLSDKIAVIALAVGFLQLLALMGTIYTMIFPQQDPAAGVCTARSG